MTNEDIYKNINEYNNINNSFEIINRIKNLIKPNNENALSLKYQTKDYLIIDKDWESHTNLVDELTKSLEENKQNNIFELSYRGKYFLFWANMIKQWKI